MKSAILLLLLANSAGAVTLNKRHHHRGRHGHKAAKVSKKITFEKLTDTEDLHDLETLDNMPVEKLIEGMQNTLGLAEKDEVEADKEAAVAKVAAIKNIQKALTNKILKRFDDGEPLTVIAD